MNLTCQSCGKEIENSDTKECRKIAANIGAFHVGCAEALSVECLDESDERGDREGGGRMTDVILDSGWLERQIKSTKEEVSTWPSWLREMDISQAVTELRVHLGRPNWLVSIGVGTIDGKDTIILYVSSSRTPIPNFLDNGWKGHPVTARKFGSIAPLENGT